jgi:hypothetical protein
MLKVEETGDNVWPTVDMGTFKISTTRCLAQSI